MGLPDPKCQSPSIPKTYKYGYLVPLLSIVLMVKMICFYTIKTSSTCLVIKRNDHVMSIFCLKNKVSLVLELHLCRKQIRAR
jgi:hypothetical protein